MIKVAVALPSGVAMLILGEVDAVSSVFPYAELVLHGGAVAVLTWAVWHAYSKMIPGLRQDMGADRDRYMTSINGIQQEFSKTLIAMADRHERWETQRHEDSEQLRGILSSDSEKLRGVLSQLSVTCAETRTSMKENSG